MERKPLTVGVSGASGRLGSATLRELRSRTQEVRLVGISRNPEKVNGVAEGRFGDFDAPGTLVPAFSGLDRLFIIPSTELRHGRRSEQNVAAVDAAVAAGVGHIVLLSSVGTFEVPEPDLLASYFRAEQRLMKTAPAWTVLRMTSFSEEFAREAQMSAPYGAFIGLGNNVVSYVSREDVAASAAGLLLGRDHKGAIYTLTGRESLSGIERAKVITAATGTPMNYAVVTKEVLMAKLREMNLSEDIVTAVVSVQSHFGLGAFDVVTGDVERLSGKPPRSLFEVLREATAV